MCEWQGCSEGVYRSLGNACVGDRSILIRWFREPVPVMCIGGTAEPVRVRDRDDVRLVPVGLAPRLICSPLGPPLYDLILGSGSA